MTTSYVTGTVSVTAGSDMVTGSGTGWLSANVAPGFLGLDSDNGNPVPVAEILSDTSLRLVKPWRGTSATGQAYWLSYDTRDGQQTVNNAQRLAEYIARLNNTFFNAISGLTPSANTFLTFDASATSVLSSLTTAGRALLGVTGAADVIPYFTSATAVATTPFGAAARSLLGLSASEDSIPYMNGNNSYAKTPITSFGRDLIGLIDSSGLWSTLGLTPNNNLPERLREAAQRIPGEDMNVAVNSGFYFTNATPVNAPSAGFRWSLIVIRYAADIVVQVAFRWDTNVQTWTRALAGTSWTPWTLTGTKLIGTVSQSSGVPTGAIIERGSNANGEYAMFADGTQIATRDVVLPVSGGSFITQTDSLPVTFVTSPAFPVFTAGARSVADTVQKVIVNGTGNTVTVGLTRGGGAGTTVGIIAIGRWY